MSTYRLRQIVSGGQTGVDRAALDVAIHLQIPHGGWCPRGRLAEDGRIADCYRLRETPEAEYAVRTERNVIDSEGTLILHIRQLSGGTKLTAQFASRYRRPLLVVDLAATCDPDQVVDWLVTNRIEVLNVAGPRESSLPEIGRMTEQFLLGVLSQPRNVLRLGLEELDLSSGQEDDPR